MSGVRLLGLPKSIGEIYGLLYASPEPLSFDQILARLSLSKGSTSQGLKILRTLGAVKSVYRAGERRDYFVAELDLKRLVAGFVREELMPHLQSGAARLDRMEGALSQTPGAEFHQSRVARLRTWHERASQLFPLMENSLS